jgi:hypothetical protein
MSALDDRYRRAMAHPKLKWLTNLVPASYRDQPLQVLNIINGALRGDPKLADDPAMTALDGAARSLAAERDLSHRLATAFYDPEIRREARHPIETYWSRPDLAKRELIDLSVSRPDLFKKYPAFDEALNAVGEAQVFHEEHGLPAPAAASPMAKPIVAATLDSEIAALMGKSATGRLSSEEDRRLDALLGARIARDEAPPAAVRPGPSGSAGGRHQELIKASLAPGGLTEAQSAELDRLISAQIETDFGNQDEGTGHGHGNEHGSAGGSSGGIEGEDV